MVQGAILYAYYGEEKDFKLLRNMNINLSGRVMLVRAGKISFAEKVGGFQYKINLNIPINFFANLSLFL